MVLVGGLGAQLVGWRDGFVQHLVARGMFVIVMDNRDVGMSDQTAGPGVVVADYDFDAFPADVCRVLDDLEIASAHVIGESMGGAITQRMAINYPDRIRSGTLFYSAPGFDASFLGDATLRSLSAEPLPLESSMSREEAIAGMVKNERLSASTGYPYDEAWILRSKEIYYDRGFHPDGVQRQANAILKSAPWIDALAQIDCPMAVIHGRADNLVKVETAFILGRHIRDAEVHVYPGMGHQVIPELWDEFVPIIMRTVGRARS